MKLVCLKVHILFTDEQALSPESPAIEGIADNNNDEVKIQTPVAETELPSASKVEDDNAGATSDKSVGVAANSNGQTSIPSPTENVTKGYFSFLFLFD